jgi:SET and MYND domain-containing protein
LTFTGQVLDWKRSHKKLCAHLATGFRTSIPYTELPADEQADCELLLKLAVRFLSVPDIHQVAPKDGSLGEDQLVSNALACFIDLIPHPHARPLPPLPPKLDLSVVKVPLFRQMNNNEESILLAVWRRFGPNNFVMHSFAALNDGVAEGAAYAHGVFSLASRLFNHSCCPTAWPAFILRNKRPYVEVRALVDIPQGEEVCFVLGTNLGPDFTSRSLSHILIQH